MIAAGREKFASVPSGGGAIAVGAPAAAAGGAAPAEEAKKEEKVEEKEESDDVSVFHLVIVFCPFSSIPVSSLGELCCYPVAEVFFS